MNQPTSKVTVGGLARSSSFAGIAQAVRVLSSVVLTPVILAGIGLEGLGVWALLFNISNSVNVIGVSFGHAYTKFTAELDAQGDYDSLSELLGSGIALVGTVAFFALLSLVAASGWILDWTGVPDGLMPSARLAFALVAASVFSALSFGCVRNVLAGLQRTDLSYKSQITTSVVYFVTASVLLSQGYGLVGLAVANLLGEWVGIALCWWWTRKLCPQLRISPLRATGAGMRQSLSLGGRFQVLYALNFATNSGFEMLLSGLMGPAMLGSYVLAGRLINLCQTAAAAIHAPMMPAFAHLDSSGDQDRALRIHDQGARAMYAVAMLSLGFVAAFANETLWLWTSEEQALSAWTLRALAAAIIFKQLSAMGTARLRARGTVRIEMLSMVFYLLSRILLVIPLYAHYDYQGFILSEAISHVATALVFLGPYLRIEGVSLLAFLSRATLRPTLVLVPLIAIVWWLPSALVLPIDDLPGRWGVVAQLIVWGLVYLCLTGAAGWLWLLEPDQRRYLGAALRRRFSSGDPVG